MDLPNGQIHAMKNPRNHLGRRKASAGRYANGTQYFSADNSPTLVPEDKSMRMNTYGKLVNADYRPKVN